MLMDASSDVETDGRKWRLVTRSHQQPCLAISRDINPEINQVLITAPPSVMIGFGLNIFPILCCTPV